MSLGVSIGKQLRCDKIFSNEADCMLKTARNLQHFCENKNKHVLNSSHLMCWIVLRGTKRRQLVQYIIMYKCIFRVLNVSGDNEWMIVAEKLGLTSQEIRYLDRRTRNPAEALFSFIANQRHLPAGEIYDILCDCGLPALADIL